MQVRISRTGRCRGIQIQKLLQKPVTITQEPGQANLVLQLKVAKITVPQRDRKVPDIQLLQGVRPVVGIVPAVRVVTEVTDLPDHQVVPQDLRFGHQDHLVGHPGHRVVPPDQHPDQAVLLVPEERDKNWS